MNDTLRSSPGDSSLGYLLGLMSILLVLGIALAACGGAATEPPAIAMQDFPWPPPKPSATASLTLGSLRQTAVIKLTYNDVNERISNALAGAGFDEKSYYGVPNGFAVVTRLEQMDVDGYPEYSNRWQSSLEPVSLTTFSLNKYLEALFGAPKGHYRLFVFIVTSETVMSSGTPVTQQEAETWFLGGGNRLPRQMGIWPYTDEHRTAVYIYEFVQSGVGAEANQNIPSTITGRQHLERAGLWEILEE
jgi:hypothetical protein